MKDAFVQGYVCAAANIIRTHGDTVTAKDVLSAVGKINWSNVNEYDRDTLAKAGLAPARRKRDLSPDGRESSGVSAFSEPNQSSAAVLQAKEEA